MMMRLLRIVLGGPVIHFIIELLRPFGTVRLHLITDTEILASSRSWILTVLVILDPPRKSRWNVRSELVQHDAHSDLGKRTGNGETEQASFFISFKPQSI